MSPTRRKATPKKTAPDVVLTEVFVEPAAVHVSTPIVASDSEFDLRFLLQALTQFQRGDFTVRLPAHWTGVEGKIADTLNDIFEENNGIVLEMDRIRAAVVREGKISQRVTVPRFGGDWSRWASATNDLLDNLVRPMKDISRVIGAVARGDLSQEMATEEDGQPVEGEFLSIAKTINTMVDQLSAFASEVTRVAREVGTEGKLGGQAQVPGVAGTWKDLTENVNAMASNLTGQVRNIADVTTAVAKGDLSRKITVDVKGEMLELKNTINTMVDQLSSFAAEVTRVAKEVGTEGRLGGQAQVSGVAGTWRDLTDNVNTLAGNLTDQVRNIALVTTAVANGDLSQKITVSARGEVLELKDTINTMVDRLGIFADEVTRVAREVGTEGVLGGQANVPGVAGTWRALTDNVNQLANNLTVQLRDVSGVASAIANGDLTRKITVDARGEILQIKDVINRMVDRLGVFAGEVTRVAKEVGTEGRLGGQAQVPDVAGTWKDLTDNVNFMAGNLTNQVRNIALVTTAVARGDLSQKMTVDVKGEVLELKNTINTMVDQLRVFADEVSRVAREVGTEGRLGGQAQVEGVAGTWRGLTDNVNAMASNLTGQVRNIADVTTAVAKGDLSRKITVDVQGEMLELKNTINTMVDQLSSFAAEVTRVAREVGTEGELGGQANVPGAAGTWKDLTDNVNELAGSLTTQLRAIAEVATAVTAGDLTRSVTVAARGEVAELKDNINQMIFNLRETSLKNQEQDWLKTNLASFSRMLQGQRDMLEVARMILSELAPLVNAQQGIFYHINENSDGGQIQMLGTYAYSKRKHLANRFALGETLVGQSALEKKRILLTRVPDDYIEIESGLGAAVPRNVVVLPVLFEDQVRAIIELASFEEFTPAHLTFLDQLMDSIGVVINTIEANRNTEQLLKQSQTLATELQSRQEELQSTNKELEEKARLLVLQNAEVEEKNREVELAKEALEDKASQLALTSRYKSEFLANMSHELRTPLNSLLILSHQLSDNPDGNLTGRQVEYAQTIHSAGNDLLALINDILDLSKIESGTVSLDVEDIAFSDLMETLDRTFRHMADQKGLRFDLEKSNDLPTHIQTDTKRLQQVLKNLLANAFKFTEKGGITVSIHEARTGYHKDHPELSKANRVVAFTVRDSGIGIPSDKQQIVFEAFQQAEGSTTRKYGGTGLGLSISREIANLLGGEIRLQSELGKGSEFTLYVPLQYVPHDLTGNLLKKDFASEIRQKADSLGETTTAAPKRKGGQVFTPMTRAEFMRQAGLAISDDRATIEPGDNVALLIEDDHIFAGVLLDLARSHGFKGVVASRGDTGMALLTGFQPNMIILDLNLPDIDGWSLLDRFKNNNNTRHIPVVVVSVEEDRTRGIKRGAIEFLTKPVSHTELNRTFDKVMALLSNPKPTLLVIEDDQRQLDSVVELLNGDDVKIETATDLDMAIDILKTSDVHCIVLDLLLPGMEGTQSIEALQQYTAIDAIPIIVFTGKELTPEETAMLTKLAHSVVLKDVRSPERLLDETSLYLHRKVTVLPEGKQAMLSKLRDPATTLGNKIALLVDDDSRNILALSSLLERNGLHVISADSGARALEILEGRNDIDVVLMDIMMPEMDGYEATRRIREMKTYEAVPVIAVTAKAMQGDRERCIEAGASDYVTKPVNPDQLIGMLQAWLHR